MKRLNCRKLTDSSLNCFKKVDNVCIEIEVKKNNAHVSCLGEKSYMIFKNGAERKVRNPYDLYKIPVPQTDFYHIGYFYLTNYT